MLRCSGRRTGVWYILQSTGGVQTPAWGVNSLGDVPVPADYNADGRADVAVYRASTGDWFIRNVGLMTVGRSHAH